MTFIDTFLEYVKSYINRNQKKYDQITSECVNWEDIVSQQAHNNIVNLKKEILRLTKKGKANTYFTMPFLIWVDKTSRNVLVDFITKELGDKLDLEFDDTFAVTMVRELEGCSYYDHKEERFLHMREMRHWKHVRVSWRFEKTTK